MTGTLPPPSQQNSIWPYSIAAEETAKWLSRPAVALPILVRWLSASDVLLLGSPIGFRHGSRRGFRLSSEHSVRRHIGRGCGLGGEDLYRDRMPRLGQTLPLAGDYGRRRFLQRCPHDEQQCNQRRTHHHNIGEDWHYYAPDCTGTNLNRLLSDKLVLSRNSPQPPTGVRTRPNVCHTLNEPLKASARWCPALYNQPSNDPFRHDKSAH